MRQLIVRNQGRGEYPEWPADYIYYYYYPTNGGFIVYQEMFSKSGDKKLQKMFLPKEMVEDLISLSANESLLSE